jgi:hypothetical protein
MENIFNWKGEASEARQVPGIVLYGLGGRLSMELNQKSALKNS